MWQAMTVANDFFNNSAEFEHDRIRERLRRDRESEREGLLEEGMAIGEGIAIAKLINYLPVDEIARRCGRSTQEIRGIA